MTVAMSATDRRHSILEAALLCFLEKGYRATSIADIRERSGASTGSIYHFFAGKGALAESLLRQALSSQTAAAPASVADAESHIKASVYGLVLWGLTNPSHLRFMDEVRSLAFHDDELMGVRKLCSTARRRAPPSSRPCRKSARSATSPSLWPRR